MSLIVLNGANSTTYDLTRFIPVPNYNINAVEEYKEWTDSNYDTHRRLVSSKAQCTEECAFCLVKTQHYLRPVDHWSENELELMIA